MARLRSTRANPPALAAKGERRQVYGAAVHQSDELMLAAASVTPVSRPILLYYAMHQAGKALAAALYSDRKWNARGHGLTQDNHGTAWRTDVLQYRVGPIAGKPGLLGGVAEALGAPSLTGGAEMGALWAALPEVRSPVITEDWLPALAVSMSFVPTFNGPPMVYTPPHSVVDFCGSFSLNSAIDVNKMLARYPGSVGALALTNNGELSRWPGPGSQQLEVQWALDVEDHGPEWPEPLGDFLGRRFPLYPRTQEFWLIPRVGDQQDKLPPLLIWWVLLHGLSLLARYEPGAWRAALDFDKSSLADPLTDLLDMALEIVPDLLADAVT